jgi:hypothetical protein
MRLRRALITLLVGAVAFCATFFVGAWFGFARTGIADLSGGIPDTFAVVLYSESKTPRCRVTFWRNLREVQASMPDWSFLVPARHSRACRGEVQSQPSGTPGLFAAGFEVDHSAGARPVFSVSATWDDDAVNRSRYEASSRKIEPLRHQSFSGPGLVFSVFPYAFCVSFAAIIVVQRKLGRGARAA